VGGAHAALILAAGQSRRMGAPKALLELEGVPLVRLHVERALELGCARVLVIVRPELADAVAQLMAQVPEGTAARVIAAETASQASSLAVLVRSLASLGRSEPERGYLIAPVDSLPCTRQTYRALCAALGDHTLACTPRFAGRGGHPVLARAALLGGYRSGPLERALPLCEVLARAGERRVRVDVPDPSVLADLDTPAQARALGLCLPGDLPASAG
jgi:molybdenum cofactor cytidylyltransferase